jgi:hypothetical protein
VISPQIRVATTLSLTKNTAQPDTHMLFSAADHRCQRCQRCQTHETNTQTHKQPKETPFQLPNISSSFSGINTHLTLGWGCSWKVIEVIFRPKPPQARISFCGITSEMHQALQHSGFWMKNQLNIHEYSRLYRCVGLFPRIIYCDRDQTRRPSRYRCVGGVQLRYRRKIPHF